MSMDVSLDQQPNNRQAVMQALAWTPARSIITALMKTRDRESVGQWKPANLFNGAEEISLLLASRVTGCFFCECCWPEPLNTLSLLVPLFLSLLPGVTLFLFPLSLSVSLLPSSFFFFLEHDRFVSPWALAEQQHIPVHIPASGKTVSGT